MNILPRTFYDRDTVQVAENLIGKILVRRIGDNYLTGIISECEAYRTDDPACHGFRGKTLRNKAIFEDVGHAYVYISYGLHFCLNAVARDTKKMEGGGVLIRAVIPQQGINLMQEFRPVPQKILTNGPGKVTQAFAIDMGHYGIDLTKPNSDLIICDAPQIKSHLIKATPRIGISVATDKLWRFVLDMDSLKK